MYVAEVVVLVACLEVLAYRLVLSQLFRRLFWKDFQPAKELCERSDGALGNDVAVKPVFPTLG